MQPLELKYSLWFHFQTVIQDFWPLPVGHVGSLYCVLQRPSCVSSLCQGVRHHILEWWQQPFKNRRTFEAPFIEIKRHKPGLWAHGNQLQAVHSIEKLLVTRGIYRLIGRWTWHLSLDQDLKLGPRPTEWMRLECIHCVPFQFGWPHRLLFSNEATGISQQFLGS